MTPLEPITLALDKPRRVLINHRALFRAEGEVNRQRKATPESHVSIDTLMVDSFNNLYRARGILPRDLLIVMVWAGLVYEGKEKPLTIEQVLELIDNSELSIADLSGEIWAAYFKANTRNLKMLDEGIQQSQEKKSNTTLTDGSTNGASPEST